MSSLKQKYIEKEKYISFRWKGQNPSKTFRFEGSFVENLQKQSKMDTLNFEKQE